MMLAAFPTKNGPGLIAAVITSFLFTIQVNGGVALINLSTPGDSYSTALGINDSGEVVGLSISSDG